MASDSSWENIFDRIHEKATKVLGLDESEAYILAEIEEAKKHFPSVRDKTLKEFYLYVVQKDIERRQEIVSRPRPTPEQFWNAAYNWDPLRARAENDDDDLYKLVASHRLDAIPLGNLWGTAKLELIPELGCLPRTELPKNCTTFGYARTDSGAIVYADGHPSEDDIAQYEVRFSASEDHALRRFVSLGWIIKVEKDGNWEKTGHCLVMDMDKGRDRRPWIVLASEWPGDGQEGIESDESIVAGEQVRRGDPNTKGLLPGDRTRTTVASITTQVHDGRPLLKQFREGFNFDVLRLGGDRRQRMARMQPDPAHITPWYWDPRTKEEVCYTRNGNEYLRYDPATQKYNRSNLKKMSFDGEIGMFGQLTSDPVPQEERVVLYQQAQSSRPSRRQLLSSSGSGF